MITLEKAVMKFNKVYDHESDPFEEKKNFYCGITNNTVEREKQHNTKFLITMKANSFETAKKMEQALFDEGYDTGAQVGHGQEDSVYVYMYKKIAGVTKE